MKSSQYGHIVPSPQGIYNGLQGGNPQLTPEIAKTYTVGLTPDGIGGNASLRQIVNNITDKTPPLVVGGDCASVFCNGNTFGGTYRALGRYLFAQVSVQLGRRPSPP